ncbi:MAG: P-II family nitrogen regulator [Deltaproteobacteria bacterium]|jgi:nitrogen regulatory protein P-II 1
MKEIRAIIRVEKLREVLDALEDTGHPGVSVVRIEGHGRQTGLVEQFRGREFKVDLLPKARLDIVCADEEVEKLVQTIAEHAKTGGIGDGKIFIYPVMGAIRIRTGETGEAAI